MRPTMSRMLSCWWSCMSPNTNGSSSNFEVSIGSSSVTTRVHQPSCSLCSVITTSPLSSCHSHSSATTFSASAPSITFLPRTNTFSEADMKLTCTCLPRAPSAAMWSTTSFFLSCFQRPQLALPPCLSLMGSLTSAEIDIGGGAGA
eukprot:CAMPEP_0183352564 /NCGR_PEP_ID=MMETSP0164_2-20130417/29519_1 /TAXON_ID=221442 /ORGANISM="Coccolithus pelagicus ssp braarudi, Strain PLY182g" /LENGTH=145 /DNA_ID=CAMNT_0025525029 /DNA_START=536 /DNA_END=970 /DNA_ORIENTATION=-